MSTLVLDLDHLADDVLTAAIQKLAPYEYVLHSSHSDRPGQRCVRVVMLLSRPVMRAEWERFWLSATAQLGIQVDQHCKDASRLYFLPTRPHDAMHQTADGSGYHYVTHRGAPIAVDSILALALAPPVKPHEVHEAPASPGYTEPSAEGRATAVRLLGEVWPEAGKRHEAYLALAGGLIRAEWSIDQVAQFSYDVVQVKTPDYDDFAKRLTDARTSYNKVMAGEPATGWPRLVEYLTQGEVTSEAAQKVVDEVRIALGLVPADDPEIDAMMAELVKRMPPRTPVTPTFLEVTTTLEKARDQLKKAKDPAEAVLGELLAKVLRGKVLSDPGEDHERVLAMAALAVVRYVPAGTRREDMHRLLLGPACELGDEVPAVVEAALEHVAREAREAEASEKDSRDLPEPANDEELRDSLIRNRQGEVRSIGANIDHILRYSSDLKGRLRFNVFSKRTEVSEGRFQHETPKGLVVAVNNWLGSHWDIYVQEHQTKSQLVRIAEANSYSPVEEYLRPLEWDGVPRLDTWLIVYCGADDTPYIRRVGAMFLISAVARGLVPGCKVDSVLVLHGLQGAKKSSIVKALGAPWFSDTRIDIAGSSTNKDAMMRMSYSWFIELPELTSLIDKDVNLVKAFLTQETDEFRTPYGDAVETFVRRCVFWGTTNDQEWMQDHTGNRRFWCVSVRACDTEALRRDRDQLYAEALHRYQSAELNPQWARTEGAGERWWFTDDEQIDAELAISDWVVEDPWVSIIRVWLEQVSRPIGAQPPRTKFILADVATEALKLSSLEIRKNARSISTAMSAAGMRKLPRARDAKGDTIVWEYIRPLAHVATGAAPPERPAAAVAKTLN